MFLWSVFTKCFYKLYFVRHFITDQVLFQLILWVRLTILSMGQPANSLSSYSLWLVTALLLSVGDWCASFTEIEFKEGDMSLSYKSSLSLPIERSSSWGSALDCGFPTVQRSYCQDSLVFFNPRRCHCYFRYHQVQDSCPTVLLQCWRLEVSCCHDVIYMHSLREGPFIPATQIPWTWLSTC